MPLPQTLLQEHKWFTLNFTSSVHRFGPQEMRINNWALFGTILLLVAPSSHLLSPPPRRSTKHIVCNTTASYEGFEKVKVSVRVDKAKIHQELHYEYVEDPTILRIEPEWSIFRWVSLRGEPSLNSHIFLKEHWYENFGPWCRKLIPKHCVHQEFVQRCFPDPLGWIKVKQHWMISVYKCINM